MGNNNKVMDRMRCAKRRLLFEMYVVTTSEFYRAVVTVGVDLPPHVGVSQFDYFVRIITIPKIIAVKFALKYHVMKTPTSLPRFLYSMNCY